MPQPASFLLSWRKKDRPQASPTQGSNLAVEVRPPPRSSTSSPVSARNRPARRPSDTPSENSTRFLRLFKGTYAETDTSSLTSLDETAQRTPSSPHSPPSRPSPALNALATPPGSPHSFERQLPPLPPVRPPRPPSLNLDAIEFYSVPLKPKPKSPGTARSLRQSPVIREPDHSSRRKMPELDNVWEGFMKETEGEDIGTFTSPRRGGVLKEHPTVLDPPSVHQPRQTLYHTTRGFESTPYLPYALDLSDSEGYESNDETSNAGLPLSSLFPAPPPLPVRRRTTPKPLVLLPTPTIAPLPPSPSWSSRDSTPVATPTTPRSVEPSVYSARKSTSPVSILKKARTPLSPRSPVSPPTTLSAGCLEDHPSYFNDASPRLRTAQSVPHLHPSLLLATNAHRNTSSDTTSTNRRRVPPSTHARPPFYPKAQAHPGPPGDVEWGYAV